MRERWYRMYHQCCEYKDLYDVLKCYADKHNNRYRKWWSREAKRVMTTVS